MCRDYQQERDTGGAWRWTGFVFYRRSRFANPWAAPLVANWEQHLERAYAWLAVNEPLGARGR